MVYAKNPVNLAKIFFKQFKMAANQTEGSRLEQRFAIKLLMAEKCKPCEFHKRMCDMYREACSSFKKIFTNGLHMGFATTNLSEKDYGKENVLNTAVS